MQLKGTYNLTFNTAHFASDNNVTAAGLVLAARLLCGTEKISSVTIGLTNDGFGSPGDTLDAHPEWEIVAEAIGSQLATEGASLATPVHALTISADGIVGGCFVTINGILFSVTEFEPRGVVQGDLIKVQYILELKTEGHDSPNA